MSQYPTTKLADRAERTFPYSYFAARVFWFLPLTVIGLFAWAVFGFDVPEGWVPIIGIQWSTFSTFFFFWYLLMVNFQVGGLTSVRQLAHEMAFDIRFIGKTIRTGKRAREQYPMKGAVDGSTAIIVSLCVVTAATFLFESIWVPLYDWFQFHSLLWPVYMAEAGGFLNSGALGRNTILLVVPLLLAPVLLKLVVDGYTTDPAPSFRYHVRLRLDFGALFLAMLAASFWLVWVFFPHDPQPTVTAILQSAHEPAYVPSGCYVFPTQGLFPQNTYTFYPCASLGKSYSLHSFYGFFVPGNALHAVNVLTKFVTFGALCYPLMVFVRRNP